MTTNTDDIHTLTGAYVLDAVSPFERKAFEGHLTQCPVCAREVMELRETAARLGAAAASTPPVSLWGAIQSAVTTTRQFPPGSAQPEERTSSWPRFALLVTAAAVAVAISLGIALTNRAGTLEDQLAQTHNRLTTISSIVGAADARAVQRTGPDGRSATAVMSVSANGMLLTTHGLPPVGPSRSIQVWFNLPGGHPVSAGLLDPASGTLLSNDLASAREASAVVLTVEPPGGSAIPSDNVVIAVPTAG